MSFMNHFHNAGVELTLGEVWRLRHRIARQKAFLSLSSDQRSAGSPVIVPVAEW